MAHTKMTEMAEQTGKTNGRKRRYQVLYLNEDVDLGVTVKESELLDFGDIRKHLDRGDSVFITSDPREWADLALRSDEGFRQVATRAVNPEILTVSEKTDSTLRPYYVSDD